MNDHLPECKVAKEFPPTKGADLWIRAACTCPELRACEQRVRQGMESLAHLYEQDAYARGWSEAISAAQSEVLSFLLDEETRMPANWMVRHIASTVGALAEGK